MSKAPTKIIRAGGAVVTRAHPRRGTEVVIIHRKRYDDWTLPKGKVENGELLPVTAVREVLEETGVTIRLNSPLDTVRYPTTSGPEGRRLVDRVGDLGRAPGAGRGGRRGRVAAAAVGDEPIDLSPRPRGWSSSASSSRRRRR